VGGWVGGWVGMWVGGWVGVGGCARANVCVYIHMCVWGLKVFVYAALATSVCGLKVLVYAA
jgi:hypothetical protein